MRVPFPLGSNLHLLHLTTVTTFEATLSWLFDRSAVTKYV